MGIFKEIFNLVVNPREGDIVDKVLGFGATFDWITPTRGLAGEAFGEVPVHMTMQEIEAYKEHGIKFHALQHHPNQGGWMANVSRQDARRMGLLKK